MKKNIVFVIPSLGSGGAEKSLINLLSVFDYSRYNVDLILFSKTGMFFKLLPQEVNLIEIQGDYQIFAKKLIQSILLFITKFKFGLAYNRILFALKNRIIKNKAIACQASWKNINLAIPLFEKEYDVAIGFLEKSSIYLTVDKINSKKKIGFIHNDYSKLGLNKDFDKPFFNKLDFVVTVSEGCAKILCETFPENQSKVIVMHNVISKRLITNLAENEIPKEIDDNSINILSVGRLHPQKGFDLAIEACNIVLQRGFNIKWYIIGEGIERKSLEDEIAHYGLQSNFFLLGLRDNPYIYLKKAFIYVQPSRYEGKSIAIDEAKILHKPIVVTNFSTVHDQIEEHVNGIITEMNSESIADGIIKMITDPDLREKVTSNLKSEELGTEMEIEKLYHLLEN